ncbi:MAG: ABC transporter ATP-binding protein [Mesorhizobium sp.]
MTSVLVKDVSLSFGSVEVLKRLSLDIPEGEFLVLLGPSGCGKSTLLNCIAGLLDVTSGQIFISGKNVTWEEPKDRGIGMVFQSYALYPQMTVKGNLSFGLKNAGMAAAEIEQRIARTAEILQIQPLLARKPSQLSGGQRQRVAIGRALVRDVDVFLFDEPLSNLDAKLRSELRVEIKRLHQRLANTMIYVTHDQIEAMTLADRIAVMKGGLIQQLDSPQSIYNRPVNRFVAGFIGSPSMNFIDGEVDAAAGAFRAEELTVPLQNYAAANGGLGGGAATLGVRPEHIAFGTAAASQPFSREVEIDIVEPMGSDTLVWTRLGKHNVSFRVESEKPLSPGERVTIGFDPARASLFDAASGDRI